MALQIALDVAPARLYRVERVVSHVYSQGGSELLTKITARTRIPNQTIFLCSTCDRSPISINISALLDWLHQSFCKRLLEQGLFLRNRE